MVKARPSEWKQRPTSSFLRRERAVVWPLGRALCGHDRHVVPCALPSKQVFLPGKYGRLESLPGPYPATVEIRPENGQPQIRHSLPDLRRRVLRPLKEADKPT